MQVTIEISAGIIASLFSSAIEGGDPVTTAKRGGWCSGIYWQSKDAEPPAGCWYANPATYSEEYTIEVVEVDDETTGHETSHKIGPADVARGLAVMAKRYARAFGQIVDDNADAPTADIFLQSILFGGEKYA